MSAHRPHSPQTNPITLSRFIMDETEADHTARASLAFILQSIGVAAKVPHRVSAHKAGHRQRCAAGRHAGPLRAGR
jgi:hypothetical protein